MMAVVDDHCTVDQNVIDAFRVLLGIIVCGHVGDTIRIEHDHIGPIAFAQQTSIFQAENLRRQEVILRTASSSVSTFSSRVYLPSTLGLVPKLRG